MFAYINLLSRNKIYQFADEISCIVILLSNQSCFYRIRQDIIMIVVRVGWVVDDGNSTMAARFLC